MADIIHDEKEQKFSLATEAGEAYVPYKISGNTVDFYYSFVPPALRGQGVGKQLVIACKEWAEARGYHLQASCGYVGMTLARLGR